MPDLTKTLDERVSDLETIYTDLPEILNLRFDALRAQASETTSRLGLMDNLIATLTRDVRDMRSGVTGQLRLLIEEQRKQGDGLDKMDQRLTVMETDMAGMKADMAGMKAVLAEILANVKK